jgi:hypothetical protein
MVGKVCYGLMAKMLKENIYSIGYQKSVFPWLTSFNHRTEEHEFIL